MSNDYELPAGDHRRLGRELNLFHLQEEAAGSVFWHPQGHTLYRTIKNYIRGRLKTAGYKEVKTPQLVNKTLWQDSGHWEKYRHNMYVTGESPRDDSTVDSLDPKQFGLNCVAVNDGNFALKPMNCPCHVQIFNAQNVSYRQLPMRMAEFGSCHRAEPSGALHGILRLRSFEQDDSHIYCTEDQVIKETADFIRLLKSVYQDFGYRDIHVGLSTRPEMRGGTEEMWDRAETDLQAAASAAGVEFDIMPGEGAFYGPKLEFALKDLKGRSWQCGTLQLDFLLPQRLKASYTGEDGNRHTPVMLHRAILGSLERFIGILLENYEGALPAWLAPTQVEIVMIKNSPELMNYAQKIEDQFEKNGVRTEIDSRDVHLNSRIKEHSGQKIPFIIVIGDRDLQNNTVSIRTLGNNQTRVEDCVSGIQELIEKCNKTCAEV